jgi:hypothetical protein
MDRNSPSFVTWIGIVLALLVTSISCLAHPAASSVQEFGFSILIIALGAAIGALLGTLASPGPGTEGGTFKAVLSLGSALASGVLINQFEAELKIFFVTTVWAERLATVRFFSFVVALLLSSFVLYAYRTYTSPREFKTLIEQIEKLKKATEAVEAAVPTEVNTTVKP